MLIRATMADVEKYGDLIYEIALDQTRSCYPTYADGIKTKEDFLTGAEKGVSRDEWELWMFRSDSGVEGWLEFFWIPEDRYLQLYACNIRRGTKKALEELLQMLAERFRGYTLYFGFPAENTEAIEFLEENGFHCIEESWNHNFFFEEYAPFPADEHIITVDRNNFELFRQVRGQEDEDIYWNCERILESIDDWIIYAYQDNNGPIGTILVQKDEHSEIFGLEFTGGRYHDGASRALLTAAMNRCKEIGARYLTFLCDEEVRETVSALGFHCVGKYCCYLKELA